MVLYRLVLCAGRFGPSGKHGGNLILKDYGKNAYTILNRSHKKAFRFSRKKYYRYGGEFGEEFSRLDEAISSDTASEREKWRQKILKAKDLLSKPFSDVFSTKEVDIVMPPYAPESPTLSGTAKAPYEPVRACRCNS